MLNTFDDIVKHYESIKPIISKYHNLADDVRPVGRRYRKYERIVKSDKNNIFIGTTYQPDGDNSGVYPYIWWQRSENGTEERIFIKNGNHCYAFPVFNLLDKFLPSCMRYEARRLYVAKDSNTNLMWNNISAAKIDPDYKPHTTHVLPLNNGDKAREIVFVRARHSGDEWKLESEPWVDRKKVVDKVKKSEHADLINDFITWSLQMIPILRNNFEQTQYHLLGADEFLADLHRDSDNRADALCSIMREIMENARNFAWDRQSVEERTNFDYVFSDRKKVRQKLNYYINRYGNFIKNTEPQQVGNSLPRRT